MASVCSQKAASKPCSRRVRSARRRSCSAPASATRHGLRRSASSRSRSEEHTSELQSLMRISYAVLCLKKKNKHPAQLDKADMQFTQPSLHKYTYLLVYNKTTL